MVTMMLMMMNKLGSLDSDKICVTSNRMLVVDNAALYHTINSLLKYLFLVMNTRLAKKFLKFGRVETEK